MDRMKRASKTDQQDQYVLTVFLPLLAIAILACAGGCCYMERRRKRRKKKNGGIDPEQSRQEEDLDDTASVVSTNSTRRRHYLMPTPTTGRLVRGASVRSNYSSYGEPLYETNKKGKRANQKSFDTYTSNDLYQQRGNYTNRFHNNLPGQNADYGDVPLARSRSMIDISRDGGYFSDLRHSSYNYNGRNNTQTPAPLHPDGHVHVFEDENTYEFVRGRPGYAVDKENKRSPSPARSEWSVRTAPPRTTYGTHQGNSISRPSSRASSVINGYLDGKREQTGSRKPVSLRRSTSQPDLRSTSSAIVATYPKGILKSNRFSKDEKYASMKYGSQFGTKASFNDRSNYSENAPQNRGQMLLQNGFARHDGMHRMPPATNYSSNMNGHPNYDPYAPPAYGDFLDAPKQNFYGGKVYSITGNKYRHHQHGGGGYAYSQHYGPFEGYGPPSTADPYNR